jgi:hypothetical protein
MKHSARIRAIGLLAVCLLPACGPAQQAVTVGGGAPPATLVESAPLPSGDGTVVARWEQTFLSPGTANAYLYAPGAADSACHLTSGTGRFDFHCENHPQIIGITRIDPLRPHVVTVRLDRGGGVTSFAVAQDGAPAAQSRAQVTGTPEIPAGGRIQLQVDASGGAAVRIAGFEAREVN